MLDPTRKWWERGLENLLEDYFISKESGIDDIKSFIYKVASEERKKINDMWLSLNLRNDNKEDWSKELDKFVCIRNS